MARGAPTLILALAGAALALVPMGAAEAGPDRRIDRLVRCALIEGDAERLACYDILAGQTIMHAFAGHGSGETASFTIHGARMLNFESVGEIMVVYLIDETGDRIGPLHLDDSGVGRHAMPLPGTYRLRVHSSGHWRMWLTVPDASLLVPAGAEGEAETVSDREPDAGLRKSRARSE